MTFQTLFYKAGVDERFHLFNYLFCHVFQKPSPE